MHNADRLRGAPAHLKCPSGGGRAECVSSACSDLCGGWSAMTIPTAIKPRPGATSRQGKGRAMDTVVNLIIQLISGVVGGNAAGAALKDYNLGNLGNTIAGAIGGVGGGQLLQALIPAIASAAAGGGVDIGSVLGQIVGGGAGGAILTVIAGLVKTMMTPEQAR